MLNSTNKSILMALGVAATASIGFYFLGEDKAAEPKKKKNVRTRRKKKNVEVTKGKLIAFTEDFLDKVSKTRAQLSLKEQQIQMNAAQQGIPIPKMEMYNHVIQEFGKEIKKQEQILYDKHGVTEASTQAASKKYKDDPKYQRLFKAIQKHHQSLSIKPPANPEEPDLDTFLKILSELVKTTEKVWDEVERDTRKKNVLPRKMGVQQIVTLVTEKMQPPMDELHEKFGINKYTFEAGIMKHSQNMQVTRALRELQMIQQKKIASMGIRMPGGPR